MRLAFLLLALPAFAQAQEVPTPPAELPGAELGCDHVMVPAENAQGKAEPLTAILAKARTHRTQLCGEAGKDLPATISQFPLAHDTCATSTERARVAELGRDHDGKRTALCQSLAEFLKQGDAFCKYFKTQEVAIRLTIGEVMSPKNTDAWTADLRLKSLVNRTASGVTAMKKVQASANAAAGFVAENPKQGGGAIAAAQALAKTGRDLSAEAQAAAKAAPWKYRGTEVKIGACRVTPGCGSHLPALREKAEKYKGAPPICAAVARLSAEASTTADSLAKDADRAKKGLLAAAENAKRKEEMMADQRLRAEKYLTQVQSMGPVTKPAYQDPKNPKPDITGLEKVGSYKPSFYWLAEEKNIGEPKTHEVLGPDGKTVIAKVSERFYTDELRMEGTAKLADGRVLNAAGKVNGEMTFEEMPSSTPYGVGQSPKYPLEPFQSVAVDPKKIPIGSELYVPDLYGMPYVDENGVARLHDGRVKAVDVGDAINGERMDVFTGVGDQSYYYSEYGVRTMKPFDVYFLSKPAPKTTTTTQP